jgi:hypothetical protein
LVVEREIERWQDPQNQGRQKGVVPPDKLTMQRISGEKNIAQRVPM